MLTKIEIRHGVITVLGVIFSILLYKLFVGGSKEALLFSPLFLIWLVITGIVLFATRSSAQA